MSYFPFDREILNSTLWNCNDSDTFKVWFYLLLSADISSGVVNVPIPTIAKNAGVSVGRLEEILDILSGPDVYSRSKEFEGKRIKISDDGIEILNYKKYKEKDYSTPRSRRYYERNPGLSHKKGAALGKGERGGTEGERSGTTNNNNNNNNNKDKELTNMSSSKGTSTDFCSKGPKIQDGVKVAKNVKRKLTADEIALWKFWVVSHNKNPKTTVVDKKRLLAMERMLGSHSLRQLQGAVLGCLRSPYHMGENDTMTKYDDIELICRDEKHFNQFISLARNGDEKNFGLELAPKESEEER
jgi:hypothetical protein